MTSAIGRRFLDLDQVSDELSVSHAQAYALVRSGRLRAVKIGGRGIWRIAREDLEAYLVQAYLDTKVHLVDESVADPDVDTDA